MEPFRGSAKAEEIATAEELAASVGFIAGFTVGGIWAAKEHITSYTELQPAAQQNWPSNLIETGGMVFGPAIIGAVVLATATSKNTKCAA